MTSQNPKSVFIYDAVAAVAACFAVAVITAATKRVEIISPASLIPAFGLMICAMAAGSYPSRKVFWTAYSPEIVIAAIVFATMAGGATTFLGMNANLFRMIAIIAATVYAAVQCVVWRKELRAAQFFLCFLPLFLFYIVEYRKS